MTIALVLHVYVKGKLAHVKETTGVMNNKASKNEEDVTFRTGTVSDIEQYV
jgi:hypothetical protein